MTAEQLYDSLLLATRAKSSARTDWNDAGRRRQDWVRQFVINYGTDENDEATVPAGSVSQALVMMNDSIVRSALAVEPGTLLDDVVHSRASDAAKVRRLCRSALSRDPKPAELNAASNSYGPKHDEATSEKARELGKSRAPSGHLLGLPQCERVCVRALSGSRRGTFQGRPSEKSRDELGDLFVGQPLGAGPEHPGIVRSSLVPIRESRCSHADSCR